jgi:prenyltransferase beta subunit
MIQHAKKFIKNSVYSFLLLPYRKRRVYSYGSFDLHRFKEDVVAYVQLMRGKKNYEYRFSASQNQPDLYSSVYAVILLGLLGELNRFSLEKKEEWADFLLLHQGKDGLFRDRKLNTPLIETCHYWGWHHLAPHMLIALEYLGVKPRHDFQKVFDLFEKQRMEEWLANRAWQENYLAVSNEIMNIGVLLQYSRDWFANEHAGELVQELKNWLIDNKRDPKTTLWGYETDRSLFDISKAVKTAYHLLPIFFFDKDEKELNMESILRFTLQSQNTSYGFSPSIASNACEDMDSIYILVVLSTHDESINHEIQQAVRNYLDWVFVNMNQDGGFVFQRIRPFQYADQSLLSSSANQSNMFGTWFRTLSIAFACVRLGLPHPFQFSTVPGYQFYRA